MTQTLALGLACGLGLLVGSFANVLIHRLPRMVMNTPPPDTPSQRYDLCWPASHCPHCQTPLKLWHLFPVFSYVRLHGRCEFCQHPIGHLYPIIELATACAWTLCAWHWGANLTGLSWALFATILITLSVIDWQTTLLPDDLTQALLWMGLLASAGTWIPLSPTNSIWGAAVGYGSLWSVATLFERFTGKQGMGAGDFKLLAALGAWVGPLALILVVLFASLSGAMVGLYLKWTQRLNEEGHIPFGPFLAGAGMVVSIMGSPSTLWMGG
jgi:leader peptidase (prepilin peptidase)/N-methyltransferase